MIDIKFVIKGLEDAKDVIRKSEITGGKKVRLIDACCNAVTLLKEQEAVKPQDAEMLIIHNGGAEEYVKDIESIVLLARKDYDIVYCGRFSEGSVK